MSKRHKHRYDYELEHKLAYIELQRQFVILILILLMYSDRPRQINSRIIYTTKREEAPAYSGGTTLFTAESEYHDTNDSAQVDYSGDIGLENINSMDDELKLQDKGNTAEDIDANTGPPQIIYSNIKVYNTSSVQCSLDDDDNMEACEMYVVSDVPVVLSNTNMQVLVEALAKFPVQVHEIKDIDKKVVIKECRLIPGTDKLFIKGMIKESIEYESAECTEAGSISGKLRNVAYNIPFKGSAKVTFLTKPEDLEYSSDFEIEFLNAYGNSIDISEKSFVHEEPTNKSIFAELESIEILETDIKEGIESSADSNADVHTFENMRKKIVVNLGLNLLQNQKVFINSSSFNNMEDKKVLGGIYEGKKKQRD